MRAKTSLWILGMANCIGLSSLALAASAPPPSADELQKWIAERAVAVRTIDAADEDFRDLEPLIDAIGSTRVVQLGEPSHGAGSSFAAKVRLIKFLHQRMGFDVVAWESGLYDVHLTQTGMRAGDDAVASDCFAADLRAFVRALRDQSLRSRADDLAEQAIAAHRHLFARSEAMRRIELDSVRAAVSGKALAQSPPEARAAWEKSDAAKLLEGTDGTLRNPSRLRRQVVWNRGYTSSASRMSFSIFARSMAAQATQCGSPNPCVSISTATIR